MSPRRKLLGAAALLLMVLATGVTDYYTGPRVSFALFYAIPITLSGWFLGAGAALLASVGAGFGLYFGDLVLRTDASDSAYLWNTGVRFVFLVVIGQLIARVRRDQQRLAKLLDQESDARKATVEQLRHRDRLALVGQVASGIAHEVGTPLNIIAGRARLICEPDVDLAEARLHAGAVIEQSERVATTIRQLLDFARRRGPQREALDLVALAERVRGLLRPFAQKRQVSLIVDAKPAEASAPIDATQIEQALSNLVMNAVQAIRERGTVHIGVQKVRRAQAAGAPESEYVELSVRDDGIGIAPENLQRIFEPFFTTQRAGEGTGLGLSITHEIVRDHGGWIDVESEPWRGSRFTIYLPTRATQSAPEPSSRTP